MSKTTIILLIALAILFLWLYDSGRWPAMVAAIETGAVPPVQSQSGATAANAQQAAANISASGGNGLAGYGVTIGAAVGGPVGAAIGGAIGGIL